MSRISPVSLHEADEEVKEIYGQLEKKMGKVLNIFSHMGNSPAALKGFLALSDAANQTSLPAKIREQVALVVGQINHCNYCLSAHTELAKHAGLESPEILLSRKGDSSDPKIKAILKFVKGVVENKGRVSNQEVATLKTAGVNDQEIVEIILLIALNVFTNYFNLVIDPEIDFPRAQELT